jgi:hypothetical protein
MKANSKCAICHGQGSYIEAEDFPRIGIKSVTCACVWECPECGEVSEGDSRVEAGMKCGYCAYMGVEVIHPNSRPMRVSEKQYEGQIEAPRWQVGGAA